MRELKEYKHPALEYCHENNGRDFILAPARYEVCPVCSGHGTHVRNDLDDSRLIDSMEEDGDLEGIEAYHKGSYDQICSNCKGLRVVMSIDFEWLPKWARVAIEDWSLEERISAKEEADERRMGA